MAHSNRVVNPFHEAFDNYAFTLAVGEALEAHYNEVYPLDWVPIAATVVATGVEEHLMACSFEHATDEESLYYTLFPTSHDPLDRAARRELFANLRQDRREAAQRIIAARERALALRQAGVPEEQGSAWEDAAGIAEGEAISLARWGSHEHLYANSTSVEPELVPAPPHASHCRAEYEGTLEYALPDHGERENNAREDAARSALRHEQELMGDFLLQKLRETQGEHAAKFKSFMDLFNQWKIDDPTTSAEYIKHVVNANMCSTSNVRIWQIIAWFRNGVPEALCDAQNDMAYHYLTEAWQASLLQQVEAKLGLDGTIRYNGENSEFVGTTLSDDDFWTVDACKTAKTMANPNPNPLVHARSWLYGWGQLSTHSDNGFFDYVPKGNNNKTMARHLRAHLDARKVWLEHMGELLGHNRETRVKMMLQWRPKQGACKSMAVRCTAGDTLSTACAEYDAWRAALQNELRTLEAAAAAKKQEKVHDRSDDVSNLQPQKRAKTGDSA
jgi:hypothetical protein